MFKKVLVAEDFSSVNKGIVTTLAPLGISKIEHVSYCDDAYLKIKKAEQDGDPFDLLLTDLSFKPDHRSQKLTSGHELATLLNTEHPTLPIIIFTHEDRMEKARMLSSIETVRAYVCKGRHGHSDLYTAVQEVAKGKPFYSEAVAPGLLKEPLLELTDFDITLLKQLSHGLLQDEISVYLKQVNMSPSSLSSVEKRLSKLKDHFGAKNSTQLVAVVKDLGII
jgi:DNA-binding NarL/FixJ family response regulator|tara:strand:+ start:104654 stop:105319 length:666 start_codon:yes stop_codon:yes gene_type:complete